MTDPALKVTIGLHSLILPESARVVNLSKTITSTTRHTMEENGVDYQVPPSKKFWLMRLTSRSGSLDIFVRQSDAPDASTGEILKYTFDTGGVSGGVTREPALVEFAAEKYVTCQHDGDGTTVFEMIGIELDA